MSKTKPLKDELKNASEVTSLESSDSMMAVGPDGSPKRISRNNAVFKNTKTEKDFINSGTRWVTIAQTYPTAAWGGILTVSHGLWSGYPNLYVFALGGRYYNGKPQRPDIHSLFGVISGIKFRIVLTDSVVRLDYYSTYRKLEVNSMGMITLIDPIDAEPIPSGATVWEYNFSSSASGIVGGGVNCYCSIIYAMQKKGGLRNEQNDKTYQRHIEGEDDGCNGGQRCMFESGRGPYPRDIFDQRKHNRYVSSSNGRSGKICGGRSCGSIHHSHSTSDKCVWRRSHKNIRWLRRLEGLERAGVSVAERRTAA